MRIETTRLRLRPFAAGDLPELARLLADPDFMAWSVAGPLGEAQARRKLAAEIASFEAMASRSWRWKRGMPRD